MLYLVGRLPVAERHQRRFVIAYVKREVQPVRIVVLCMVVQAVIVSYILEAPAEPFELPVGLRVVRPGVDQLHVEVQQLVLE